ncbi:hypothetical protein [Ensifer aridi]|uniref:hypothetical protein n=1 Tax=Ensifer aridi TaxID=1708715 RepID=UPI000A115FE3|nr:hypothetical protein [Ensifer aridi]
MEYVTKSLTNPLFNLALTIVVSIVVGVLTVLYTYKLNHINRKRFKKYLNRRLDTIHRVLFMPRDAFFTMFIVQACMVITGAIIGGVTYTVMVLMALNSEKLGQQYWYGEYYQYFFSVGFVFTQAMQMRNILRLMYEMKALSLPKRMLAKLRAEVVSDAKREFLRDEEIDRFTQRIDEIEAAVPKFRTTWANLEPAPDRVDQTPAPSREALPAQ